MKEELTSPGSHFNDRSKTNAEILLELYQTIRKAAGKMLLIGCNTVSHLSAGIFDLMRAPPKSSPLRRSIRPRSRRVARPRLGGGELPCVSRSRGRLRRVARGVGGVQRAGRPRSPRRSGAASQRGAMRGTVAAADKGAARGPGPWRGPSPGDWRREG